MLDPRYVLENADFIVKKTKTRGISLSLDKLIKFSQEKKDNLIKIEKLRHEKNKASELVAQKKKEGKNPARGEAEGIRGETEGNLPLHS
jgi:seryl-tRNA synthetase